MFLPHIHVLFLSRLSSYNYTELYRKLHFDITLFQCVIVCLNNLPSIKPIRKYPFLIPDAFMTGWQSCNTGAVADPEQSHKTECY